MKKYTYKNQFIAHLGSGTCVVPDQVSDDQRAYEGRTFPALRNGRTVRVRLVGEDYDLYGSGTGDMVVRYASSRRE